MNRFMKAIALAVVVLSSTIFTASAKIPFIMYGITAGTNVSTVKDATSGFGYQGGLMFGIDLPLIEISTEAIYSQSNFDYDAGLSALGAQTTATVKSQSIDIPVLVSMPVFGPIRLKVGPSFNVYNDATAHYDDSSSLDMGNIKSTMGYVVGLGINLFKITCDVRFNGQFKDATMSLFDLDYGYTGTTVSSDVKTNTFSLNFGYRF